MVERVSYFAVQVTATIEVCARPWDHTWFFMKNPDESNCKANAQHHSPHVNNASAAAANSDLQCRFII